MTMSTVKQPKSKAPTYVAKDKAAIVREKKSTVLEREMERIFADRGAITTAVLIEEATDPASPLHSYFEWDDTEAAKKFRTVQATQMIMATKFVCVLAEERNAPPRVVSAVPQTRHMVRKFLPSGEKGAGFAPRESVLSDVEERARVVEKKKAILRSWCAGVIDIAELDGIRGAIEAALSRSA